MSISHIKFSWLDGSPAICGLIYKSHWKPSLSERYLLCRPRLCSQAQHMGLPQWTSAVQVCRLGVREAICFRLPPAPGLRHLGRSWAWEASPLQLCVVFSPCACLSVCLSLSHCEAALGRGGTCDSPCFLGVGRGLLAMVQTSELVELHSISTCAVYCTSNTSH